MGDAIQVRAAVSGDERALVALIEVVQQVHVTGRPDVFKPAVAADLEIWAAHAIAHSRVLLAESGGELVGYALVIDETRADNPFAYERRWREVDQLCVHPLHRRRGVAHALLEHIAAAARADGIPTLELNAWTFNATARTAFERLGFVAKTVRFERPAK